MNNTKNTAAAAAATTAERCAASRGFGRLAARCNIGQGEHVLARLELAAFAVYPGLDGLAFRAGFKAERRRR